MFQDVTVARKDLVKGHLSKSFVESVDKEQKDSKHMLVSNPIHVVSIIYAIIHVIGINERQRIPNYSTIIKARGIYVRVTVVSLCVCMCVCVLSTIKGFFMAFYRFACNVWVSLKIFVQKFWHHLF